MQPEGNMPDENNEPMISGDVQSGQFVQQGMQPGTIMIDPNTGLPQNIIIMQQPSAAPKVIGIFVIIYGAIGVIGSALGIFGSALLSEIDDDLYSDYSTYLILFALISLVISVATIFAGTQILNLRGRGVQLAWAVIAANFIVSLAQQVALPAELSDPSGLGQAINVGMSVVCTGICGLIVAIPLMVNGSGMDESKLF
jgi:hypothetical protein